MNMNFESLSFILIFLPIALLVYYVVPRRAKNPVLLLLSILFYAWGQPVYVILLVLSVLFNYLAVLELEKKAEQGRIRKRRSGPIGPAAAFGKRK